MRKYIHAILALTALLFSACSSTRNMPEDEVLYRGIKRLEYDRQKPDGGKKAEGVITAIADAYNTVEGVLSGDASVLQKPEEEKAARERQKAAGKADREAYATTRDEVEGVLSYAPNGALMGSSYVTHPLPFRLWIYNRYAGSSSSFGKWMYQHFATNPVYLSTVNPKVRTVVARNTLQAHGFLRSHVSFDTIPLRNPRKAKVTYHVSPGPLFHTDSIQYLHFPHKADSIIRATRHRAMISQGKPFSVADLEAERNRLNDAFRNQGYFFFRPEYITFRADTLRAPERVQLQVIPSPSVPLEATRIYHIGNTRVNLYKYNDYTLTDSTTQGDFTFAYSGGGRKAPLQPEAMRRFLLQRKGQAYRQLFEEISTEKLSEMGVFSNLRINYVPRDSIVGCDTLDVLVTAVLDKPFDVEFQGNVTSKSNGQVGPGLSFSMQKHNAFRGAETLGFKAWGSYEWQTGANIHGNSQVINSYEYGLKASLSYPRVLPMRLERRLPRRTLGTTGFAVDAKWMNRANYFGRVSIGASVNYVLQKRRNIRHEFSPLSLDYDILLNRTQRFDSIVNANQALYVSMRNQFVPCMEYTYSWKSTRHLPRTFRLNLKEAGNVTSGIYSAFGKKFSREGKELFGVPFAQYLKLTAQYTHQFNLTRRSCIATRAFGGIVYSYGNAISAPFGDLFSIGGANSIRAFAVRSIGPGAYHPAGSQYSYIDEMGDLKLEVNAEYRFPIVAKLFGAAFLDAGNVWLLHTNETQPEGKLRLSRLGKDIALGTGAGLRYDLDFLVLRFDVGVGIHAPYDTGRSGYYNMPRFRKSLGFHFAVGYPF